MAKIFYILVKLLKYFLKKYLILELNKNMPPTDYIKLKKD